MPSTKPKRLKKDEHAAGLQRFASWRDEAARAFLGVTKNEDWGTRLAADPLIRPHLPDADLTTLALLGAWGRFATRPSTDPVRRELYRACAFYERDRAERTSDPHPLAVLLLAQAERLFVRLSPELHIFRGDALS